MACVKHDALAMACVEQDASGVVLTPQVEAIVSTDVGVGETLKIEAAAGSGKSTALRLFAERRRGCSIMYLGVVGGRREGAFNPSIDPPTPRTRPAAHASAQRPAPTSPIGSQPAPAGAALWRPSWAKVVMQPWLRERRLSLGAAAQGQYYLSGVKFAAPPPSDSHFPRPIRPEPPLSPTSSTLTEPCMRVSGTVNGAGTGANGTVGTAHTPGIATAVTAAAAALSSGSAAAFPSILWLLRFFLRPLCVRRGPEYSRWAAWAAPGRRRAARPRSGGGLGACRGRWGRQRRLLGAAMRFRSRFFVRVVQLVTCATRHP
jgi:hypothetical protein